MTHAGSHHGPTTDLGSAVPRVPIDDVIITPELGRRPLRARDLDSEHRALTALTEEMAGAVGEMASGRILQRLVDTSLSLCQADSAGVSMVETDGATEQFRWRAIAGEWAHLAGGTIDRHNSPCGLVVDTNKPALMARPHRHYGLPPGFSSIAEVLLIPFHFEERPVGTLWVATNEAHRREFDAEDLRVLTGLARFASVAHRLMLTQDGIAQLRLEADLADSRLLQAISAELITENDEHAFHERLLDAAISIMRSDSASLQIFKDDQTGGHLDLIAHRGFSQEAVDRWQKVDPTTLTTCGELLRTRQRVIADDLTRCDFLIGSDSLAFFLKNGVHAIQSTPLLSRTGRLLGVFSTHWRRTHRPSERDLRLLDILARQAADLIERMLAEERLRDSDRRKEEFLATLAHELRNPLAPILNAIQWLNLAAPVGPELQWARDVIERQTTHLTRLVDDLLDVSRINHDHLQLRKEPVDLARIVQTAVETTQPFVADHGQTVTVLLPEERVMVEADLMRLSQVFANLINNASKFSSRGGSIEVVAESEGDVVRVRVRDRGIGIAAGDLPSLFDLFRRVHPSFEHDHGGLGVGLTLVKRLVEMHGGTVSATSAGVGLGSEFVVQLPVLASASNDVGVIDGATDAEQRQCRILVVDDHEDGATSMCRLLRVLGYEARQANDGLAGLEAAAEHRPDIVMLDIGMPKLNGYEVARRVRAEPWGASMRLIAVTGWGQDSDKERAREAGFDEHLTKPVAVAALTLALANVTGQSPLLADTA